MLRAIETTFQGYRFRSRIEARWAVFYTSLGVHFDYEPEGYVLEGAGPYLPDFWLPEINCWVEIKGLFPNAQEIEKTCALSAATERSALIFHGQIEPGMRGGYAHPSGQFFAHTYVWASCDRCQRVDIVDIDAHRRILCPTCRDWRLYRLTSPKLRTAYEAARAARFEFSG